MHWQYARWHPLFVMCYTWGQSRGSVEPFPEAFRPDLAWGSLGRPADWACTSTRGACSQGQRSRCSRWRWWHYPLSL